MRKLIVLLVMATIPSFLLGASMAVGYSWDFDTWQNAFEWFGWNWSVDSTNSVSSPSSLAVSSGYGELYSPQIVISGMTNPELRYYCKHFADSSRKLRILDGESYVVLVEFDVNHIVKQGVWHEHSEILKPEWGSIVLQFAGSPDWNIDNVRVQEWSPFEQPNGPGVEFAPSSISSHEGGGCFVSGSK